MSRGDRPYISEIYRDSLWQPDGGRRFLDIDTAHALREEGVTMVRIAPSGWVRLFGGRSRRAPREVSVHRYLQQAQPDLADVPAD